MTDADDRPAPAPGSRVAILHAADRTAAEASALVATGMRTGGHDVIEVDGTTLDPFADHGAEWQQLLAEGPLIQVVSVGGLHPAAVGLAMTAGAPLLLTPLQGRPTPPAGEATTSRWVPVLRVDVDHGHRFTVEAVAVTANGPHSWAWCHEGGWHLASAASTWHATIVGTPPAVAVQADDEPERLVDAFTMESREAGLQVEIDRRSRRATMARVALFPRTLQLLMPAQVR